MGSFEKISPFLSNNLYGIKDANDSVLLNPFFTKIELVNIYNNPMMKATFPDGSYGLLYNYSDNNIVRIYIPKSTSGDFKSCQITKNGLLVSGIWVRHAKYWIFSSFDDEKYGIMDCQQNVCIEPVFDFALSVDNLASALDLKKWDYDKDDPKPFDKLEFIFIYSIENFQENKSEIFDTHTRYPDAFLYYDEKHHKTVIANFDDQYKLVSGNHWFFCDGKFGLMNEDGKILIKPLYDRVKLQSNGLAEVNVRDNYALMDNCGNAIIPVSKKPIVHYFENVYLQWESDTHSVEIKIKDRSYWKQ